MACPTSKLSEASLGSSNCHASYVVDVARILHLEELGRMADDVGALKLLNKRRSRSKKASEV